MLACLINFPCFDSPKHQDFPIAHIRWSNCLCNPGAKLYRSQDHASGTYTFGISSFLKHWIIKCLSAIKFYWLKHDMFCCLGCCWRIIFCVYSLTMEIRQLIKTHLAWWKRFLNKHNPMIWKSVKLIYFAALNTIIARPLQNNLE